MDKVSKESSHEISTFNKAHSRTMGQTSRRRKRKKSAEGLPVSCACRHNIIALRMWMKNKAHFKSQLIPAEFSDTGRGLMTKTNIKPGEIVISVPVNLLITTTSALQSEIGEIIKCWKPKLTPMQCLIVLLVWEKHKDKGSEWYPYIDILPSSFTTPAYFSSRELSLLPISVRTKASDKIKQLKESFEVVAQFSKGNWKSFNHVLSFEDFKWAWYVVNTRSVFFLSKHSEYICDKETNNIALVPFLDFFNHSPTANIKASYNKATCCYEIVTYDDYTPYNQVFLSYGCHGNQNLFIEYGFCVPENPHDAIEVSLDDILSCPHAAVNYLTKKLKVLLQNDLLMTLTCSMDGMSWKLWTVMKTLVMDWTQLQNWVKIYTDEDAFIECVPEAKKLANCLLQKYLSINMQQTFYINQECQCDYNLEHLQIVRSLLTVEKDILIRSLQIINELAV